MEPQYDSYTSGFTESDQPTPTDVQVSRYVLRMIAVALDTVGMRHNVVYDCDRVLNMMSIGEINREWLRAGETIEGLSTSMLLEPTYANYYSLRYGMDTYYVLISCMLMRDYFHYLPHIKAAAQAVGLDDEKDSDSLFMFEAIEQVINVAGGEEAFKMPVTTNVLWRHAVCTEIRKLNDSRFLQLYGEPIVGVQGILSAYGRPQGPPLSDAEFALRLLTLVEAGCDEDKPDLGPHSNEKVAEWVRTILEGPAPENKYTPK